MTGISIALNTLEDKTFLLLVIAISLAFAWILWPFYGAVLWGAVLAIVFAPLYRRFGLRRLCAAVAVIRHVRKRAVKPASRWMRIQSSVRSG